MATRRIGVIGSGTVGETLANGFLKLGYEVQRASREPKKLAGWKEKAGPRASIGTNAEAARFGELIVLAVKGDAAESAVKACSTEALGDKVVIDACNPIAESAPEQGVLKFFTGPNESLMERLQKLAPRARFVKAFSSVGALLMVNPDFGGTRPTMFLCGNDPKARIAVREILDQFGWETEDLGGAMAARAIEPLCMLWCIPGFLHNRWSHAFKLLRKA
jgi:predicted dinucleotide-binding enzyme